MRFLLVFLLAQAPAAAQDLPDPGFYRTAAAPLDLLLQTGFKRWLAARPGNPAAGEMLAFWQAHPEIEFRSDSVDSGAWALYDPALRTIQLSRRFLAECGIESHARDVTPAVLDRFLGLVAPVLAHEFTHARLHLDTRVHSRGSFEEELLAHAVEAWFVSTEPALATPENAALGAWWLDRMLPQERKAQAAEKRFEAARDPGERARFKGEAARLRLKLLDEKRARAGGRNDAELQYLGSWVAMMRSWKDFERLIAGYHAAKPRLAGGARGRRRFVANLEKDLAALDAGAELPPDMQAAGGRARMRVMLKEGIAYWGDEERVAAARRDMEPRLAALRGRAGAPDAPDKAAR